MKIKRIKKIRLNKTQSRFQYTMPKLSTLKKLILYLIMILFIILSLWNVNYQVISNIEEIIIYACAAILVFLGGYYLVLDLFHITSTIKRCIESNSWIKSIHDNFQLKMSMSIGFGMIINIAYTLFNGTIAIFYRSAWLGTLAAYYLLLSIMRVHILFQGNKIHNITEGKKRKEMDLKIYRNISILFIIMAIVLCGAVILLYDSSGGKAYPGYTIYIAAMFSFYKIISATFNLVKEKESLLLKVVRRIGYLDACFSILTLQSAMFASFSSGQYQNETIMNAITGTIVYIIVLYMGIQGLSYINQESKNKK